LKLIKSTPKLVDELTSSNESLEEIEKALQKFMETKRAAFPRFNFLSDDELLEILAEGNNPAVIQGHLKTCFDGIVKLDIQEVDINAMISKEKEVVKFSRVAKIKNDGVENWLLDVEK